MSACPGIILTIKTDMFTFCIAPFFALLVFNVVFSLWQEGPWLFRVYEMWRHLKGGGPQRLTVFAEGSAYALHVTPRQQAPSPPVYLKAF